MSEQDGFHPDFVEQQSGGFRQMVRSALGRLGADNSVSVGTEVELYRDEIEPVEAEIVTGQFTGDRLAERPRTARLPERFLERDTLAQMKVGKSAYTVPWAMAVTTDGFCYLNGSYTFRKETGGTVQMMISRTKDGHVVYVPRGYKYQPSRTIPWVGCAEEDLIPVHEVKEGRTSY